MEQEGAGEVTAGEGKKEAPLRLHDESCKVWDRPAGCGAAPSGRREQRVAPREAVSREGP